MDAISSFSFFTSAARFSFSAFSAWALSLAAVFRACSSLAMRSFCFSSGLLKPKREGRGSALQGRSRSPALGSSPLSGSANLARASPNSSAIFDSWSCASVFSCTAPSSWSFRSSTCCMRDSNSLSCFLGRRGSALCGRRRTAWLPEDEWRGLAPALSNPSLLCNRFTWSTKSLICSRATSSAAFRSCRAASLLCAPSQVFATVAKIVESGEMRSLSMYSSSSRACCHSPDCWQA
mmetsp:Transcript_136696/g.237345  ORF Transcript_136696/g.237345 Transcript_136696/m.237345 type:complete len:235 (+) Transcript_136696:850-1554(+)